MTVKQETKGLKERAAALANEASTRPEDPTSPGKFMTSTLATLAVGAVVGAGLLIARLVVGGGHTYAALMTILAVVAGLVALTGLLKVGQEALQVSPGGRTTPEKALKAYFGTLMQRRWDAAASCLSWLAKNDTAITLQAMPDVDLAAKQYTIGGTPDLVTYWGEFYGGFKSRGSRFTTANVRRVQPISDTVSLVHVEVRISLDLRTADFGGEARKRRKLLSGTNTVAGLCQWPVYLRDGLWYLLVPGFPEGANFRRV